MKRYLITSAILAVTVSIPAEAGDMPSPGADECAIISAEVQRADATLIDPTPAAESMLIISYCGHQVTNSTGGVRTERALKYTYVNLDEAEVLVDAAGDLLDNGDVFLSED